jgi:predicted acyltransferase
MSIGLRLEEDFRGGDQRSSRLMSLDVFRGLTVAAMILVTDPGTYAAVYPQLRHAVWQGATAADMIFPSFLVMVGAAMTLSFRARLMRGADRGHLLFHALRRGTVMLVLGLVVNGFPNYDLHNLRLPGILQRIAVCYVLGACMYLAASEVGVGRERRGRRSAVLGAATVVLLGGYWALLKWYPVPGFGAGRLDPLGNVAAYYDRAIFGVRHMFQWGVKTPGYGITFDPEGVLSTTTALATLLMGVLAGEWLGTEGARERKAVGLLVAGGCLVLAGYGLSPWLPLNKSLLTSTFAMFSGGVAFLFFSLFYWVLDVWMWRMWAEPALVFGTNAILAFALSQVVTTVLDLIHVTGDGGRMNLHAWLNRYWFATWLPARPASLGYAVTIVGVNLAMLYPLYRRRIFVRV